MRLILITLLALLAMPLSGLAQPSCGDPPRVDDQTLKGDLEGKAKFLSGLVGDAGLKGQIEAPRGPTSSANTRMPARRGRTPIWNACSAVSC